MSASAALDAVRADARGCRACPLWEDATQTVFGEGPPRAPLMLVGEQPGDREDLEGRPFVGPAGALLRRALDDAGLEDEAVYLTNVVKHFKWKARGRRRIHDTPDRAEIEACRPWLERELELVRPRVVLCLGATAGRALLGPSVRVNRDHGRLAADGDGPAMGVTFHPSAVIRAREPGRAEMRRALVDDLAAAGAAAGAA